MWNPYQCHLCEMYLIECYCRGSDERGVDERFDVFGVQQNFRRVSSQYSDLVLDLE